MSDQDKPAVTGPWQSGWSPRRKLPKRPQPPPPVATPTQTVSLDKGPRPSKPSRASQPSHSPRLAWLRRWSSRRTLVAVALVAALVGVGIGTLGQSGTENRQRKQISTGNTLAADLQVQLTSAVERASNAEANAQQDYATRLAQADALKNEAQAAGEAKAEATYAPRLAKVKAREDAVAARETAVKAREVAVTGAEQQAAANTISGTGTFLVGTDIQPGTYRAAGQQGCYWERLSNTSGSFGSIIANGLSDGQVVVTIAGSDAAFRTSGCSDFHKIG